MSRSVRFGLLSVALATGLSAFGYSVTGVSARQHWPWDNKVDVNFTLSDTDGDQFYHVDILAQYPGMAGDGVRAKTLLDEPAVRGNGAHRIVWDMGADIPGLYTTNLTVSVTLTPFGDTTPVYLVVDLSGGSTASSYPVRYTTEAPDLSQDTCRTTELWLKRCPAGTFTMGQGTTAQSDLRYPAHTVKLTQPYYIGVFEVTQEQWYRVMGTWPSVYSNVTCRATRPVENVRWYDIRHGGNPGTKAPEDWAIPSGSIFMYYLRNRTAGMKFDLPTEAQWEQACRAGTTADRYFDGDVTQYTRGPWLFEGVYVQNAPYDCDTRWGTAKVGSYPANPWGLYDMIGNVQEVVYDMAPIDKNTTIQADIDAGLFADTPENLATYYTDPWKWPKRTSDNVVATRGSGFSNNAETFYSFARSRAGINAKARNVGFRVSLTVR